MRDGNIIQAYTDSATGIELECIQLDDGRAIWGAWHPAYMGKPAMAIGDTAHSWPLIFIPPILLRRSTPAGGKDIFYSNGLQ